MNKLYIYQKNKRIMLYDGKEAETIFNEREYRDVFSNIPKDEYGFFTNITNNYGIKDSKEIEEKFSYIFNFVLVNNLANYVIDRYLDGDYSELVFDETIRNKTKQTIKLTGRLDVEDALGDIIICFINSDAYLNGQIKIDYGHVNKKEIDINFDSKGIDYLFRYSTNAVDELVNQLEIDLVAFEYIKKDNKNISGRYVLPIYVDIDSLISKGIDNYQDFLVNWKSIAYLKMITTIHDFFVDYYNINTDKGLVNDNLMLALITLFDCEIVDYPKGLEKSIEVGRATKGKCYFIDGIVSPIAIPQELAMVLQSRDLFSVVPKVFRNKL